MKKTILFLFLIVVLSTQVRAETSDDLELLDLETPGCGNGGSNYMGETTTHDPLDVTPDISMEPTTSVTRRGTPLKKHAKADIQCIDTFEREANDPK